MYEIVESELALKTPCKPTTFEIGLEIADQLSAALTASKIPGCGLAANQIGIDARVCIIRMPRKDAQGFEYTVETAFINPVLTELKKPVIFSGEGCLSFPMKRCQTLRYVSCKVVDLLQPDGRTLQGLDAIVVQHEIDHLNGTTMYDRLYDDLKPNRLCPCGSTETFKNCCKPKVKEL